MTTLSSITTLVARTGRHQQRYEDGYRLVAGCIPYRYTPTGEGKTMEVLMISSQKGQGLLFPKGGWETDETVEEAACRESLEEAGVRGILQFCQNQGTVIIMDGIYQFGPSQSIDQVGPHQGKLGSWDFKSKRQQGVFCPEGMCRAHMFALAVTEQLDTWPEQARHRQWFAVSDAIEKCRHDWMRGALEQCVSYLASAGSSSSSTPNLMLASDTASLPAAN